MRRLRDATLDEVVAATPDDPATRKVTETHQPFEVWRLESPDDLGQVRMQLPTGEGGTIAELYPAFLAWIDAPERTPEERARYFERHHDVETEAHREWTKAIVLGPGRQIHDGKHRLLAAYAHAIAGIEVSLDVFWGGVDRSLHGPTGE